MEDSIKRLRDLAPVPPRWDGRCVSDQPSIVSNGSASFGSNPHHSHVRVSICRWLVSELSISQDGQSQYILGSGGSGHVVPAARAVGSRKAAAVSARIKGSGNALPRFSARRNIPAQAVELKKYCAGIEPLTSTCDNEHTAAALGQSVILGILDPPCRCSLGTKHTTSVRPFSPCWDERITFAGKASKETAECSRLVAK